MYLINEYYEPIKEEQHSSEHLQHFWIYDFKEMDFFLKTAMLWQSNCTAAYHLKIGKGEIFIPYNYYIMIGDYDGGLDFITPDEIIGRKFEAFTFSNDFDESSWELQEISVLGYNEEVMFMYPYTKSAFPVLMSNSKALLVSQKDMFTKIKEAGFGEIL